MNKWVVNDYRNVPTHIDVGLVIADPIYSTQMVNDVWERFAGEGLPTVCFMYPEDLVTLAAPFPDQICHWVKPVSTKNTIKRYSRFVEVVAVHNVKMTDVLHWSCRTGVFTDALLTNDEHPFKKPESLIERLIRNHYTGGIVLDPCAGSGTVHHVCVRLGIPSISIEIDPRFKILKPLTKRASKR